jgi:hypothetical protein
MDRLVTSPDPIAIRRARIDRGVRAAKAVGYSALLTSIVVFVVAAATDFPGALVIATVSTLAAATAILPVPIVLGYGLRAAERDERRRPPTGGSRFPPGR